MPGEENKITTNLGRVSIVPRGSYDPEATYTRLDYVLYGDDGYLARKSGLKNVTPADGDNWMLAVGSGSAAAAKSWAIGEGLGEKRPNEAEDNAKYYAGQAKDSQTAAAASAENAKAAKSGAETAQGAAADSAAEAKAAQGAAETARTGAQTAQGKAEEAKSGAETARDAAVESQKAAAGSAGSAESWSKQAQSWAVGEGYSERADQAEDNAKTYAEQAKASAKKAETFANGDFVAHSEVGAKSGVASLDENTKVPAEQLPVAGTALGGVKSGGDITVAGDGAVTVNGKAAASHKHAIGDVTSLQDTLDGKAAASHTHAEIVSSSAKESAVDDGSAYLYTNIESATKKAGTRVHIGMKSDGSLFDHVYKADGTDLGVQKIYDTAHKPSASDVGAAAEGHTHPYAGSGTAGGAANSVAHPLKAGGKSYNGSAEITLAAADVGAAAASHTHPYAGSGTAGGAANSVAHPLKAGGKSYNGSAEITLAAADVGAAAKWTLLWKNANPTAAFAAQTLSLSISAYNLFMVTSFYNINYADHRGSCVIYAPDTSKYATITLSDWAEQSIRHVTRDFLFDRGGNKIVIGKGVWHTHEGCQTGSNDAVPLYIFGTTI